MELSVIIVSWNTRELLAQCLESVYANPPTGEFEIIVVDNDSADGSVAMVRERFPQVILIENSENVGFARANNQAIRCSSGEYVLLLNSDAMVLTGVLDALLGFFGTHSQAGALGPMLVNPDGSFQASYARFPTLWSEFSLMSGIARLTIGPYAPSPRPLTNEPTRQVDWVAGAAFMVRRTAIDQVGFLDESYAFYSEETDYCWRLHRQRWQVWYIPSVKVIHIGSASSRKRSLESYLLLYESKVRFFRKAYGRRYARRLRFVIKAIAAFRLMIIAITMPIFRLFSGYWPILKFRKDVALFYHALPTD